MSTIKNKHKFAIIGGDLRQVEMANRLAEDNYYVKVFGFSNNNIDFNENILVSDNIEQTLKDTDIIITPLPCSLDNKTINACYYNKKIFLQDVFKHISKQHIFFGGKISDEVRKIAVEHNVNLIDYFEREELKVLNAIPTTEGAVQIAMEESSITLHGSNCLVLGFGRVGKTMAQILKGLGANVTVEARKWSDIAWAKTHGYKGVHIQKLVEVISGYDFIFNTIPSIILNKDMLLKIKKDCLVIDLASKPGGVNFKVAAQIGIKVIWALSLPGKVAPKTAGNIVKNTIINIINELGG